MKKILVAVDASTMANAVVAHAVELARAFGPGSKLRLFHAVPVPVQVPVPGAVLVPPSAQLHTLVEAAHAYVNKLVKSVPEDLRDCDGAPAAVVEIGPATETVLRVAEAYGADLVVIGAHEHHAISRALGTTAARIVNRMARPVLVVRPLPMGVVSATAATTTA